MSKDHTGRIYIPNQNHYEGPKKDPYDLDLQQYVEDKAPAGGGSSYLVYTALINQSGTNDPTVTVLGTNTIGNIVWQREGPGSCIANLAGAFPVGKTWFCLTNNFNVSVGYLPQIEKQSVTADYFTLEVFDLAGVPQDTYELYIEIRVYP